MLKVGLTGGIACGKSYVLAELRKSGAYPLDADEIAHSVITPEGTAYSEVIDAFGSEILTSDRIIDRKKLGAIVFSDRAALDRLNQIVHPHVFAEEKRQILAIEADVGETERGLLVIDAALMIEVGTYRNYDSVIVVYCRPAVQLHRLMQRDNLSSEEALKRIQSQMPVLRKLRYADYVVDNSGERTESRRQIRGILAQLILRQTEKSV